MSGILPSCAADSMPLLQLKVHTTKPVGPLGGAAPPKQPMYGVVSVATVLGIAGIGAAGWALRRRQRTSKPLLEGQPLMPIKRHDSTTPPFTRRARLADMLQQETEGSSRRFGMVPLQALPAAFTHQLRGRQRGAAAVAVGPHNNGAGSSALASELAQPLPSETAALSLRASACPAAEVELGEGSLEHPATSSSDGGDLIKMSRQWGLDTTSLQLEAKELEVCVWIGGWRCCGAAGKRASLNHFNLCCLWPCHLQLVTGRDGRLVELGEGAYAVVYLGSLSGAQVAVKVSTGRNSCFHQRAVCGACCLGFATPPRRAQPALLPRPFLVR